MAYRLTPTRRSPRDAVIGAKGSTTSGYSTWVLHGRATSRRGLGVVWPEENRHDPRSSSQASHPRPRRQNRRTLYDRSPARSSRAESQDAQGAQAVHRVHRRTCTACARRTEGRACRMPRSLKKTGHGLDHWFAVLDRFGAVEKGHTASARHLYEDHGVDGWYAQGITVVVRARARRARHESTLRWRSSKCRCRRR